MWAKSGFEIAVITQISLLPLLDSLIFCYLNTLVQNINTSMQSEKGKRGNRCCHAA